MATEPRTPDNMPAGLLTQADQLPAAQAEHGERINRLVADALAAGSPDDGDDF